MSPYKAKTCNKSKSPASGAKLCDAPKYKRSTYVFKNSRQYVSSR